MSNYAILNEIAILPLGPKKGRFCGYTLSDIGDVAFDLFSLIVNVADVITDLAICLRWYHRGMTVFFALSVAVFIIAQVSYALVFTVNYASQYRPDRDPDWFKTKAFICILPFAHLVPALVWFQSYRWPWLDRWFEALGLDPDQSSSHQTQDPLRSYIMKKLRVHGGFIVESVVESVPQSILQMVAIVTHAELYWVDMVSLTVSILSVATRGFVISYSIHRPTFVFNFTCFVADVFGVFCTVSWLFFVPAGSVAKYAVWFLPSLRIDNLPSVIWVYKFLITSVLMAVMGVLGFLALVMKCCKENRRRHQDNGYYDRPRWLGDTVALILITIFSVMLFAPGMVVVEALTLSFFPMIQSLDSEHGRNALAYGKLFDFLLAARSRKDFTHRVFFANRFFAVKHGIMLHHIPRLVRVAERLKEMEVQQFQLSDMNEVSEPITLAGTVKVYKKGVNSIMEDAENAFHKAMLFIFCFIFVPVHTVSSLLSVVYPIVCFCIVPVRLIAPLQLLLTLIVFACFLCLVILSYPVGRFLRCLYYLNTFTHTPQEHGVDEILREYKNAEQARTAQCVARVSILAANLLAHSGSRPYRQIPVVHVPYRHEDRAQSTGASSNLSGHIMALLPMIDQLAGFPKCPSMDVGAFTSSRHFRQLLHDKACVDNSERDEKEMSEEQGWTSSSSSKKEMRVGKKQTRAKAEVGVEEVGDGGDDGVAAALAILTHTTASTTHQLLGA